MLEIWKSNYNENLEKGFFDKYHLGIPWLDRNKRLRGYPGVIVLAGPSLDDNIEELKKIKNKAVIIAADTVVYRLNEEGISPDFVVSIDPQKDFLNLLTKDIKDRTPYLVIPTTGSPKLIEEWKGYIFFFNQYEVPENHPEIMKKHNFFKKLTKPTKHFGYLVNKYFVGMTAFQLSTILDLHPITFVGADFAEVDNRWYIKGFEERRYEGRKVDINFDANEGRFRTTKLFLFYRDTLRTYCLLREKNRRIKYFDSSKGILKLNKITLKEFREKYCNKEFDVKDIIKLKG